MNRHMIRYQKLINFYKLNVPEGYVERHHIIPRCLGGTDNFENIVVLPARAHYLAHYFLWKSYPEEEGLSHAFAMMAVNNPYQHRVLKGKLYELSKIARSKTLKGKKRSEETKEKMRKPKSEAHRLKFLGNTNGRWNKGKKHKPRTDEHKKNLAESLKKYKEKERKELDKKIENFRNEFINSNISRREFADKCGVNYNTMKKYLRGL